MKVPVPDMSWVQPMLDAYRQDGVRCKAEYDDNTAQWFINLDDADYEEYEANLKREHDAVCDLVKIQAEHWQPESNIQFMILEKPDENATRLTLYLVDPDCGTVKAFKLTSSIQALLGREFTGEGYGSRCEKCGKRTMALLRWEDVKPKGGHNENVSDTG